MTHYQVRQVDKNGTTFNAIELDCRDDAAAIESAKQFIDGHDIELWHLGRKVAAFELELPA